MCVIPLPHIPHIPHTRPLIVYIVEEGNGKVLVVANDDRTCYQLRQYLCEGGQHLLEKQLSRLNTTHATKVKSQKIPVPSKRGVASSKQPDSVSKNTDNEEE